MPSRARLMASSATRWVRWRIKVKAHVLALICPFTACCGSPSAPSWQAPRACKRRKAVRYASRTTSHVTCVTRHAQNAKPTSRCRTVAPWRTTMRRVFHPEINGVKASPHRHKWMLSHGALAAPSDPWNAPIRIIALACAFAAVFSANYRSVDRRLRWPRLVLP